MQAFSGAAAEGTLLAELLLRVKALEAQGQPGQSEALDALVRDVQNLQQAANAHGAELAEIDAMREQIVNHSSALADVEAMHSILSTHAEALADVETMREQVGERFITFAIYVLSISYFSLTIQQCQGAVVSVFIAWCLRCRLLQR